MSTSINRDELEIWEDRGDYTIGDRTKPAGPSKATSRADGNEVQHNYILI
jgi:hypothetical protein